MQRTRIKLCGITRPADASAAVEAGVDAIGLVFYEPSPRAVSLQQAQAICAVIPPFVSIVGLTVNAEPAFVQRLVDELPLHMLQFHGDETPEQCERYARPYIKAVRMRSGVDSLAIAQQYTRAAGLLFDSYQADKQGGTGEIFDWLSVPPALRAQIILAGGLDAANVEQAIATLRPFAVDVSGGVERIKPCICPAGRRPPGRAIS